VNKYKTEPYADVDPYKDSVVHAWSDRNRCHIGARRVVVRMGREKGLLRFTEVREYRDAYKVLLLGNVYCNQKCCR
jgi:hypothetical protein